MNKKLVIFDLDGTLLNTIDDLAVSANYALRQHGYPEHELPAYRYFVGNGITKLIERALPEAERCEPAILQLREEFVGYYQRHKTTCTRPYPGIPELLSHLSAKGIQLAVASNKYHQGTVELIRHYFGTDLFKVVLGQRGHIPAKPRSGNCLRDLTPNRNNSCGHIVYRRFGGRYANSPAQWHHFHRRQLGLPSPSGTDRKRSLSYCRPSGRNNPLSLIYPVMISAPVSVISTVYSHCAEGMPSSVNTVQSLSASIKILRDPILIIGSIVNTIPGTSKTPVPRRPTWLTKGSS